MTGGCGELLECLLLCSLTRRLGGQAHADQKDGGGEHRRHAEKGSSHQILSLKRFCVRIASRTTLRPATPARKHLVHSSVTEEGLVSWPRLSATRIVGSLPLLLSEGRGGVCPCLVTGYGATNAACARICR